MEAGLSFGGEVGEIVGVIEIMEEGMERGREGEDFEEASGGGELDEVLHGVIVGVEAGIDDGETGLGVDGSERLEELANFGDTTDGAGGRFVDEQGEEFWGDGGEIDGEEEKEGGGGEAESGLEATEGTAVGEDVWDDGKSRVSVGAIWGARDEDLGGIEGLESGELFGEERLVLDEERGFIGAHAGG